VRDFSDCISFASIDVIDLPAWNPDAVRGLRAGE
jgi:hypothetical protein